MIMPRQEEMILTDRENVEELRQLLLDEIWAGAASGLGAVLLDEQEIRRAGPEELETIAQRYGLR